MITLPLVDWFRGRLDALRGAGSALVHSDSRLSEPTRGCRFATTAICVAGARVTSVLFLLPLGLDRSTTMDCIGCEVPVTTHAEDENPMCDECLDAAFAGY